MLDSAVDRAIDALLGKAALHRLLDLGHERLEGRIKNKSLENDVKLQLANCYLYSSDRLDSVWYYLQPSLQENNDFKNVSADFIASEYYWATEKDDSAKIYLSQVLKHGEAYDKREASRRLLTIEAESDSCQLMLQWMDSYLEYGDSVKQNITLSSHLK